MTDGSWWKGFGWVALGYVVAGLLLGLLAFGQQESGNLAGGLLVFALAFGVVQLLWVIPLAIWKRKEKKTLWGILVLSGVLFLLNTACWGVVGAGGMLG